MLHWWGELVTIPDVEDPRRMAWKICASFVILAIRCEAHLTQDYTVPPAPECLTCLFLPDNPTYQDIQWQLLLLTLANAQALQYWVEKVNPPTLDTYCPLAMSVLELKWQVEEHIAFSKPDVFSSLKDAIPEARSQNAKASPEGTITLPITSNTGGVELLPATTHGTDNGILALPDCTSDDGATTS